MNSSPVLQIDAVSCRLGGQPVLRELSLQIESDQYYALAGENGAGKSTLIKVVLDLIRLIDSGRVQINGIDRRQRQARDVLAYLPEKFDLRREVTGWQYLCFVFGAYRQSLNRARVLELCEQLALDAARLDHKAGEYSKGMKQKLGLISCFMLDKPLLILDEPLSGLDPKARFLFKQLLQQERSAQRSVFYSTHMLADAEEICDQFGILHQGRIVFDGSPSHCLEQYQAPTLEQAYMKCIGAG